MSDNIVQRDQRTSVFGATGFIGSRFCELYPDSVEIISRNRYLAKTNDILYLISTTDNYNVFTNPFIDIETNLIVLLKVLENNKNQNVIFNFISSWFVYGDTDLPAHEDSICNPKGFYSITKKAAEDLLISYCKTFHLNYRILRLCNIYGPKDSGISKKKNALQYMISQLKRNEKVQLYQGGEVIRDYLHIDDACRAIKMIIESAPLNSIINVGSGKPYLIKDIIGIAYKVLGSQSEIVSIPPPEFHTIVQVKDMYLDVKKLESLGFMPSISMGEGVTNLCHEI